MKHRAESHLPGIAEPIELRVQLLDRQNDVVDRLESITARPLSALSGDLNDGVGQAMGFFSHGFLAETMLDNLAHRVYVASLVDPLATVEGEEFFGKKGRWFLVNLDQVELISLIEDKPKVRQPGVVVACNQSVVAIQMAMDHVAMMGVANGTTDLRQDAHDLRKTWTMGR